MVIKSVGLAEAKAHLSTLDAVEAGDGVVITLCGQAVARLIPDRGTDRPANPSVWGAKLRRLHGDHPRLVHGAVQLVRELRKEP